MIHEKILCEENFKFITFSVHVYDVVLKFNLSLLDNIMLYNNIKKWNSLKYLIPTFFCSYIYSNQLSTHLRCKTIIIVLIQTYNVLFRNRSTFTLIDLI